MKDLFPYSQVRESQTELKQDVERALKEKKNVVAHAPTGLGKTAATLAPSLAYALENNKTVFFLTPRHSQHEIAVETLKEIKQKHGETFTAVDLIGKKWLCEGEGIASVYVEEEEESEKCPRHDATYNDKHQLTDLAKKRIREFRQEILRAEEVKDRCDKVCPYEILVHMASKADVIIGDYFHIFHPGVREVIFSKSQISLSDCIIIVDEAHNLPSRTRDLNSAHLSERLLKNAKKEASKYGFYEEEEKLEKLQKELQRLAKNELGMERETKITKKAFKQRASNIAKYQHLIDDLGTVEKEVRESGDDSHCGAVANFLDRWTGKDTGFVRVLKKIQRTGNPYLKLSYTCLDPQYSTREPMKQAHTSICMSGTLTPVDMYVDIFGLDPENTISENFRSPFPEEKKLNLIVDKVTTRYKDRDEKQFQKIAWYVMKSMEHVDGNVGVFFPSYKLRDKVYEKMKDRADRHIFLEDRRMDKQQKNELLDRFASKSSDGAALLGVVGGSFGEGVDFPGKLMSATFVVGLPLQRPGIETKALIDFYEQKFGRGWDYGYNFPAVNRALQAAGRCIRSKNDRGVVIFMDERYKWNKYLKAMPNEDYRVTKAPWNDVGAFFGRQT